MNISLIFTEHKANIKYIKILFLGRMDTFLKPWTGNNSENFFFFFSALVMMLKFHYDTT